MLLVLALATMFGAWKGMAWQVASISSLVLSAVVAVRGAAWLAPRMGTEHEAWNRFLAMLALFLLTSLAIWIVFRMVAGLIDRVQLKEFDRQIGALFGLVKGALLCVVITFFAVSLSESTRQMVLGSRSGYYISEGLRRATPFLPPEVREHLGTYIDRLLEELSRPPAEMPSDLPGASVRPSRGSGLGCRAVVWGRAAGSSPIGPGQPGGQRTAAQTCLCVFIGFLGPSDRT